MSVASFAVVSGVSALIFTMISFLAPDGKMKNACEKIMTIAAILSMVSLIPSVIGKTDFSKTVIESGVGYDSILYENVEKLRKEYVIDTVKDIASESGIEVKDCVVVYENRLLKKITFFLDEKVISDESLRIHISEVRKKTANAFFISEENIIVESYDASTQSDNKKGGGV